MSNSVNNISQLWNDLDGANNAAQVANASETLNTA